MPSFNLGALNAETDWVPTSGGTFTAAVDGTFAGTVSFFYRPSQSGTGRAIARDLTGTALAFTAPSGVIQGNGSVAEPDAQIQARMTAYTSGTAVVRIGRD